MSGRRRFTLALGIALLGAAAFEGWLPARVAWEPARVADAEALRAEGLVLQDERGDEVWASRGYGIYRSRAGGAFEHVTTIVPLLGSAWAGFSRTFRERLRYQELAEVMVLDERALLAFAGGDAYRIDLATGDAERVHRLRYFGPGRGRGLMPHGLSRDAGGAIYYGEYPTGELVAGETVRIWRSRDDGRSWQTAHEFAAGAVRHIHAVQWDPIGDALWVATGDRDAECRVGFSRDGGASFQWIGAGSQRFRGVSLLFTPEAVSWVMDSPAVATRQVRWERATGAISESALAFPAPGYYAQALGGERGLATLAESAAAVWIVGDGVPRELVAWPVHPNGARPHPAVRLLRSTSVVPGASTFLLNPLRTDLEGAAIYRVPVSATTRR